MLSYHSLWLSNIGKIMMWATSFYFRFWSFWFIRIVTLLLMIIIKWKISYLLWELINLNSKRLFWCKCMRTVCIFSLCQRLLCVAWAIFVNHIRIHCLIHIWFQLIFVFIDHFLAHCFIWILNKFMSIL